MKGEKLGELEGMVETTMKGKNEGKIGYCENSKKELEVKINQ